MERERFMHGPHQQPEIQRGLMQEAETNIIILTYCPGCKVNAKSSLGIHRPYTGVSYPGQGTTCLPSSLYDKETQGTGRATETPEENANKLWVVFEIVRRNMEKVSQDQARHY